MSLPGGYAATRTPHAWAFALEGALPWAVQALGGGGTLHGWAAAAADRREMTGRGAVFSVPAPVEGPDGCDRWVVRHYFRGGAVARFLTDRYLAVGRPRPLQEACAHMAARARGIPTPAAVAGAVYRTGAFYRADLVTEEIPDATDLAGVLFPPGEGAAGTPLAAESALDPAASLAAAGRLVRLLERAGLFHPDLNAKNIVLRRDPAGPRAHLVDLDRCCVRQSGVPAPALAMRQRLERSLRKFERRTGRRLDSVAWAALRSGWEETR